MKFLKTLKASAVKFTALLLSVGLAAGAWADGVPVWEDEDEIIGGGSGDSPISSEVSILDYCAQIGENKYGTIQAAIDAAQSGDTITLLGNVSLSSKVILNKEGIYTIDGAGYTILMAQENSFDAEGAIIFGPAGTTTGNLADIPNKTYTLQNVTITSFDSEILRIEGCGLTLDNVTFDQNYISTDHSTRGYHLVRIANANVSINDSTFSDNTVANTTNGRGIYVDETSQFTLSNCVFDSNTVNGSGVVTISNGSNHSVVNNTFKDNTVASEANGAVLYLSKTATVTGNLFKDNSVTESTAKEGVIVIGSGGTGSVINNNAFDGNTLGTSVSHYATIYTGSDCDITGNYWGDGAAPEIEDHKDVYDSGSHTIANTTYATEYALRNGTGPGVTVTPYVPANPVVTFQMTDSVGKIVIQGLDDNVHHNVFDTWNDGVNNRPNIRIAFTQTVEPGGTATKPTNTPYYDYNITQPNNGNPKTFTNADSHAYTFDGWATADGELYDFTTPVASDLVLHPRFSATGTTIVIHNEEELRKFAREVELGRKFRAAWSEDQQTVQLAADITLTSAWTPVGGFEGIFDGDNHSISGLVINSTEVYVGFFSGLNCHTVVKDLTFVAPVVSSSASYVGVLAGSASSNSSSTQPQVSNVNITGAFSVSGQDNVGALIGQVNAGVQIEDCTITGTGATVTAAGSDGRCVGGLLGNTEGAEVSVVDCSVSGVTVTGYRKIGGLIGQVQGRLTCTDVSVSNVTLHTNATTDYANTLTMGGLVGIFPSNYSGSTFTGTVSDLTMTGPESIASGKNYIMGLVSGGTGGTAAEAESAMTAANMTFDVTISGTNTRTVSNDSTYAGINGTVVPANHTVTFDLNAVIAEPIQASYYGGMSPDSTVFTQINLSTAPTTRYAYTATVVEGETVPKPFNANGLQVFPARRDGYIFDGWQLGGVDYDFTTPVTSDITLTAKWRAYTDSITIANAEEFLAYATMFSASINLSDVTATLTGDINFTNTLRPWGPLNGFSGNLDGDDHKITGLNISATAAYAGLFDQLRYGTISNLTIESPTVSSTASYVGALAGTSVIPLTNVHVTGTISVTGVNNVGGLVGVAGDCATFVNCSVSGTSAASSTIAGNATSGRPIGGMIGNTTDTAAVTLTYCLVSNVTVMGARKLGGLIGQIEKKAGISPVPLVSCTDCSVSNVTLASGALTTFSSDLTMGGMVGIFATNYGADIFTGTVSDITMTGPESIASNKNYVMGFVTGGTGGTVEAAETAMSAANMTFYVTVSGTNTRTVSNDSTYAGINGNQPAANVAKIGETEYETLAAAIDAAEDGHTIVLLCDIALTGMVTIDKSVKIDGDGNTITVTKGDANYYALYFLGETRAIDCEIKNATIVSTGYQVAIMGNCDYASTLKVENVDITCDGECIYANGFITVNATGCEFLHEGLYAEGKDPVYYSAIIVGYSGTINLTDCDIVSFGNGVSTFPSGGTVTMTNVNIDATEVANSQNSGFAMWVRNEDYTYYPEYCTDSTITFESGCVKGNFKVTDIYTGDDARNRYDAKTFINGGIFSVSPAGIDGVVVKDGYKVAENTDEETKDAYPYAVVEANYVAQIVGGAKFESLDDAFAAANAGDTVTLLADITYPADRSVPVWGKPVNINLGGYTLTTNSEVGKDLPNNGYTAAAICFSIANECNITISNGKIVTAYGAGIYADDPGLVLTLSNLTIEAATAGTQSTAEYSAAVRVTWGSHIIIESGSYSGAYALAASNSGAVFEINGGTFAGREGSVFFSGSTDRVKSVTITDGTFKGGIVNPTQGTLSISGGYYSVKPGAEYVVEGKLCTTKPYTGNLYKVVDKATVTFAAGTGAPAGATVPERFDYPSGDRAEIKLSLPTYTSEDYTFGGWTYTVDDKTVNIGTTFPAGTTGDKALVGTWTKAAKIEVVTDSTKPTEKVEVKVTEDWVKDNVTKAEETATVEEIQEALTTEQDNGLTGLENYVLGLNGKDPYAKLKVDSTQSDSETSMPVVNTVKQTVDTGFTVKYSLDKVDENGEVTQAGEQQETSDLDLNLAAATSDSNSAYFKMTATITKNNGVTETEVKSVPSENTIGVMKVESQSKTTVIGVPWTSLSDDGSISVADIVRTSTLSEGDQIQVYDTEANGYRSWTLDDKGAWVADEVIGGGASTEQAQTVKIDRGKGVLLTRTGDKSKPIYLVGSADNKDDEVSTTLEKAPDEDTPAWNLVASPSVEAKTIEQVVGENTTDSVIVPTDEGPRNYTYKNGEWGYDGFDGEPVEIAPGIFAVKPKRITNDKTIPAGRGFWYLNKDKDTSNKKINW